MHVEPKQVDNPRNLECVQLHSVCRLLLICSCVVSLVSCSYLAGPQYKQPDMPAKTEWSNDFYSRISAAEAIRPDWWIGFGDPYLNQLILMSIQGNFDLKVLAARIEVAGAGIGAEKTALLPRLTGTTGANISKSGDTTSKEFSQSFSLNWEIDIWGKARKGIKAKKADYKASEADWRAGFLTLVANVASRYFDIRQFDEQIARQENALETNRKLLNIYKAQYKEGLIAHTELLSQKAEVTRLEQALVELHRQRDVAELQLTTLLGIPAGNFQVPAAYLSDTVQAMDVPVGLPSDLLRRRPDIIAQEYAVLSAYELVGQARLAQLPTISLTGSAGSTSSLLSNLLKAWTYGLSPSINIPIFDPNIRAAIKTTKASAHVAEETYRATVMKAFEEVETALVDLHSRKAQKKLLEEQIKDLIVVRNVRHQRLKEGLVSQLEVFETERSLLSAQLEVLQLHKQILADTVTLYKALGGGWPKEYVGTEDH